MERKTLLLNANYFPVQVIHWQEACKLKWEGNADVLVEYDEEIKSPSVTWKWPAVMRLKRQTKRSKSRVVRFSRAGVYIRDNWKCQYCLTPDHKVLTSDLKWVQLGDLRTGDKLIGFEDEPIADKLSRRFEKSIVLSHVFDRAPVWRVTLEDGTKFRATNEHRWLAKEKIGVPLEWFSTNQMVGKFFPRLFNVWETEETYDAGWLSGIFDGEGWIQSRESHSLMLAVAQNPGLILEKIKTLLDERGFQYSLGLVSGTCQRVNILGNAGDKAALLGSIRPIRLLDKLQANMLGTIRAPEFNYQKVVEVSLIGYDDIVKMETSTGTFIADGFPHHNCGNRFKYDQLTLDHVVPRSKGGQTNYSNVTTSCGDCNCSKGNKSCDEWGRWPLKKPVVPAYLPDPGPRIDPENLPPEWEGFCSAAE